MNVTPVKLQPYQVYRQCETGVSFYRYFLGNREIGSATVPSRRTGTLYLHTSLMELLCDFDMEMTVVPGVCRELFYADREIRNDLHAKIVYQKCGLHTIYRYNNVYDIHYRDGKYYIYENKRPLAYITVNNPVSGDQSRLTMYVKTEITDDLATLLLSFPLLQISYY